MLIKVHTTSMIFYKYFHESMQIPFQVPTEGLVAFPDYDNHFNIDRDKSDELPNKTSSEKFYKSCWNHCREVLVIRFDCIFNLLHIISFNSVIVLCI